ncbi:UNC45-central and/or TPR 11 domain containing protein [Asbolus verrucosus]|uniref:Protein unc-45 homolog B n=1 Tax=Asbolus verrucosus TaxID=1661398 RepID=A0A482W370_ASBVE|nr:UNC45-central and/or TPR 11 domain containing protein [Asbolus verrucosus]
METTELDAALKFKGEGNEAFKNGDWDSAAKLYTKAINSLKGESKELAVFFKNRAAAYLKLNKHEPALNDCNRSLEIVPNDPKALFRRCQALESLERYEEAYRDATQIFKDDPNNKFIQPVLERLHKVVQERVKQNAQTSTKIESMSKFAFDLTVDTEKRETAMNNLMVLARENAGSAMIIASPVVQQIKKLLKVEKNRGIYITGIRIIGELCKHNADKTKAVMRDVGIPWFLEILDSKCEKQVNAAQYCIQQILNIFSGMDNKPDTKPDKELCEKYKKDIDMILTCLVFSINNRMITGLARDAIMELLMKNIHYTALNWAEQLVDIGGIERLMECASELEEYNYESAMNITPSTRTIAAVCLSRIYDNMYYDAAKDKYMEKIQNFIKDKLLSPDIESKVRVAVAITALLRGPLEVGNAVIGKEGIIEMILVMANTDDVLQQKVACECIVAAASKADKAKAIISQGVHILKQLYKSQEDSIRVRALVGLCKLGSSGGSDAALKPFAEGSNLKLAEACRRFLLHPGKDQDVRKWAAEGLSYLTLDAEVKEKLVEDKPALQSLIELARTGDQSCLFGVVTTLVNLCNAYEKQEVIPEMVELAKFAKQHIPEEHELDDPDFVTKRILALGNEGVTTALVALSKTESPNSQELIARVFNALCSEQELRGTVVQQGGSKALMSLALKGTEKGKRHAAQALARIAITMNPEVAFPGQRALEVIRPLVSLLHQDCSGLENFEALMGLCNIAQMSESARQRILKEGGLAKIEHYMFEDHQYLCRAATQCLTNMTMSEDVVKIHEGNNDKVKYLVSLAMDEDVDTGMAAAGALAILTGASKKCCEKLFDSKNWLEAFHMLLANPVSSMQYRGVCIVRNVIESSIELTEKLMETDVMEILMALTKLDSDDKKSIVTVAEEALKIAENWGVIKKPGEDD